VSGLAPPGDALNDAVALIDKVRRLIVIVGYGARDVMGEGIALAEWLNAPVLTTLKPEAK
jgi:pyruvate oxidase